MSHLIPGEYDVALNGVQIHYTVRGSGPPLSVHSGGPGLATRDWHDFARIDEFVTLVAMHFAFVEEPEKFYRVIREFRELWRVKSRLQAELRSNLRKALNVMENS